MAKNLYGDEEGLAGYWALEEGSGQKAGDRSAEGNDGVLGLGPNADNSDPAWIASSIPITGITDLMGNPLDGEYTGIFPSGDGVPRGDFSWTFTILPNLPPNMPFVQILPSEPTTLDDLVASATGSADPEGAPVSYRYEWHRNNVTIPDVTGPVLNATRTRRDQTFRCVVTPSDGDLVGPSAEASATISNTPPSPPEILILPERPNPVDGFAVWIENESIDVDGDQVLYMFEWFESSDGSSWNRRPELSGNLNPFFPGVPEISRLYAHSRTQAGEYWRVDVTPVDFPVDETNFSASSVSQPTTKDDLAILKASAEVVILPDLNQDNKVDSGDLLLLKSVWEMKKVDVATGLRGLLFDQSDPLSAQVGLSHLLRIGFLGWYQEQ
jgi:hypothetical protein